MSADRQQVTVTLTKPLGYWREYVRQMREAEFFTLARDIEAQLPMPKPAEPTNFGAVVKDYAGEVWVHAIPQSPQPWLREGDVMRRSYDVIDVVEVLFPGVES